MVRSVPSPPPSLSLSLSLSPEHREYREHREYLNSSNRENTNQRNQEGALKLRLTSPSSSFSYARTSTAGPDLVGERCNIVDLAPTPLCCLVYKTGFMSLCSEPSLLHYIWLGGPQSFSTAWASL